MDRRVVLEFWAEVENCLIKNHGLDKPEAIKRINNLRARLNTIPAGHDRDMIYHVDPRDIAYDLSQEKKL